MMHFLIVTVLALSLSPKDLLPKSDNLLHTSMLTKASVCHVLLTSRTSICTKPLPYREALKLAKRLSVAWARGDGNMVYLSRPYLVYYKGASPVQPDTQ